MGDDSEVSSSSSYGHSTRHRNSVQNNRFRADSMLSQSVLLLGELGMGGRGSSGSDCLTDELEHDLWDLDLQNVYNNNSVGSINNNNGLLPPHLLTTNNMIVSKRRDMRNSGSLVSSFSDSCSSGNLILDQVQFQVESE